MSFFIVVLALWKSYTVHNTRFLFPIAYTSQVFLVRIHSVILKCYWLVTFCIELYWIVIGLQVNGFGPNQHVKFIRSNIAFSGEPAWRQEFFSTEKISTELFPTEHFPTEVIPTRVFLYRGYTYTEVKPTTQYSYRVFIYTTFFIHTILHTEVIPTRKFFRKNLS